MKKNRKKLQVAFLGGGINSAVGIAHYTALNIDNEFEVVAGYFSRNNDINYQTADRYRVSRERTYDKLECLVESEKGKVDAVIVLTPTDQHFKQVQYLIEHSIPVICEKALTVSVEEAKLLKKVIMKHDGFLRVIYNYLGYPMVRELRHLIETEELGTIKHIQVEMPQEGYLRRNLEGDPKVPQDWRLKDNEIPTLSLDLGVHLHMFIRYLVGNAPLEVVSNSSSLGNFSGVTDNINCIIKCTEELTCGMWYSKVALGERNGLKISVYGDVASAGWVQEDPEILQFANAKGRRWVLDRGNEKAEISNKERYTRFKVGHPGGFVEAFANYYLDLAQDLTALKNGGKVSNECFGIDESLEGLYLFNAVQKSSVTNSWEKISEDE